MLFWWHLLSNLNLIQRRKKANYVATVGQNIIHIDRSLKILLCWNGQSKSHSDATFGKSPIRMKRSVKISLSFWCHGRSKSLSDATVGKDLIVIHSSFKIEFWFDIRSKSYSDAFFGQNGILVPWSGKSNNDAAVGQNLILIDRSLQNLILMQWSVKLFLCFMNPLKSISAAIVGQVFILVQI